MYQDNDIGCVIDESVSEVYKATRLTGGFNTSVNELKALTNELRQLKTMISTGNFKFGLVLTIIQKLGLYGIFDRVAKLYVHNCIERVLDQLKRRNRHVYDIYKTAIRSLKQYSITNPMMFNQLKTLASNTHNYNDNAFKVLIYMVTMCPEVITIFLSQVLNVETFMTLFMSELPLVSRLTVEALLSTVSKIVIPIIRPDLIKQGYPINKRTLYAIINQKLKPLTNISERVINTLKFFGIDPHSSLNVVLDMASSQIASMINKVDPYGVALPFSTYICYDIIVIRTSYSKSLKIILAFVIIIIIVVILLSFKQTESFINIPLTHTYQKHK